MDKIVSLSHSLVLFLSLFRFVMVLFACLYWRYFPLFDDYGVGILSFPLESITVNAKSKILCFIITCIPLMVILYGIQQLIRLFESYRRKKIFTRENAEIYYKLGRALFWYAFADYAFHALLSIALSFQNTQHGRFVELSIYGAQIVSLVLGLIVIVIGRVMIEAYKSNEELKYTV